MLIPFDPAHLVRMEICDTPDGVALLGDAELLMRGSDKLCGPAATLLSDNGEIIGCGGIRRLWDGVGEAWGVPSKIIGKHGKAVYGAVQEFFEKHRNEFHRIQATAGFDKAAQFLESLGFEYEGTLRKYGPSGTDFRMYAIVR
jgi:hypothetical protein